MFLCNSRELKHPASNSRIQQGHLGLAAARTVTLHKMLLKNRKNELLLVFLIQRLCMQALHDL